DVLVDTSFLYALYAQNEQSHKRVSATTDIYRHRLLIPYVILTETAYLFKRNGGMPALIAFVNTLAKAKYRYEILIPEDFTRVGGILTSYQDAK
ncbi:MAG TPA: hypothetical protein PLZ51_09160, partial [Aggregatilineales bacterium]|nr:hypothetical protein [Aggregatilineales bacterium]